MAIEEPGREPSRSGWSEAWGEHPADEFEDARIGRNRGRARSATEQDPVDRWSSDSRRGAADKDVWPEAIVVEQSEPEETVYQLPRRPSPSLRWTAVGLIVFGGAMGAFMIFWTQGFAEGFVKLLGPAGLIAAFFAMPGFLAVLAMWGAAIVGLFGWTELRLQPDRLLAIERLGPFRWTRRIPRGQIGRLVVQLGLTRSGDAPSQATPEFSVLLTEPAIGPNGREPKPSRLAARGRLVVIGYPQTWVQAVASDLAARLGSLTTTAGLVDRSTSSRAAGAEVIHDLAEGDRADDPLASDHQLAVPVVIREPLGSEVQDIDRDEQPAGSLVVEQPLAHGCTLTIPAPGVWKGSAGLFGFSLFWCGFMAVFSIFMVPAFLSGKGAGPEWVFVIFLLVFWGIGIGTMVYAINLGRRQAAIALTASGLRLIQTNLWGADRREWAWDELRTIRVGPSGMEVNDVPVLQLQIQPEDGSPFGLLAGRPREELEWLATRLRRSLREFRSSRADDPLVSSEVGDDEETDVDR